ncbi:hypothetical protein [Curtobacterium luteum]|uniref:hypothetical protein n=1 Tax=Curtobacterium luteum TaxID=33881 RepID=UPI00128EACC7|nr:hypothetical protein [Curtobacterium luteum]
MRKSTIAITVIGAALVGAVGTSAVSALDAHDDAAARTESSSSSAPLLSLDQVPGAWRHATAAIHEPLPEGFVFPAQPPAFFDPDDPQTPEAFVPALPKQIAARWWRCAWIASARDAVPAERVAATERAESMVDRWYEMDGVKGDANFSDYDARMRAAAEAAGESRLDIEYELDCGRLVFEEKGHS